MITSAFIKAYLENRFVKPKAIEWYIEEDHNFTDQHMVLILSNPYTQKKISQVFQECIVDRLLVGEIIRRVEKMIFDLNAENIETNKDGNDMMYKMLGFGINPTKYERHPSVEKVIFNNPATIVFWKDGTKTVVKCKDGEEYDKWAGLAMCHMKKLYGKEFHKTFRDLCEKEEEDTSDNQNHILDYFRSILERSAEK